MSGCAAEHRLAGEEVAEAAEGGHHFVGDVQHVVALAQIPHPPVVARGRDDHAAGAEHRLGDERPHPVGAQFEDLAFELRHQAIEELGLAHSFRSAVVVGTGKVVDALVEEVELGRPVGALAAQRHAEEGRAVVGVDPRDDVLLGALAAAVLVVVHEADRGVHGGGTAGGEEHVVEVAGGQLGELAAEFDGARVGHVAEGIGIGQQAGLLGHGASHFLAPQADVGAPHAAHRVEVAVAGGVVDIGAVAGGDVQRAVDAVVVEHVVAVHVVGLVGTDQVGVAEGDVACSLAFIGLSLFSDGCSEGARAPRGGPYPILG